MQLMSVLDRILDDQRMLWEAQGRGGIGHDAGLRVMQNHLTTALSTVDEGGAHAAEWDLITELAAAVHLTSDVAAARHDAQKALKHLWSILDKVRKA